jgi:hypothetical protein
MNDGEIGKMVMESKMNLSIKTLTGREVTVTEEKKQGEKKKRKEEVRRRLRWEVGLSNVV